VDANERRDPGKPWELCEALQGVEYAAMKTMERATLKLDNLHAKETPQSVRIRRIRHFLDPFSPRKVIGSPEMALPFCFPLTIAMRNVAWRRRIKKTRLQEATDGCRTWMINGCSRPPVVLCQGQATLPPSASASDRGIAAPADSCETHPLLAEVLAESVAFSGDFRASREALQRVSK